MRTMTRLSTKLFTHNRYPLPGGRHPVVLRWVETAAFYVRTLTYELTLFSCTCLLWIKLGGVDWYS